MIMLKLLIHIGIISLDYINMFQFSLNDIRNSKPLYSSMTMHQILKNDERIFFLTINVERGEKYLPY